MKRAILVGAILVAACNNKPAGFGVDVEARTNMLPSAVKSSIVSARLLVSGAESFQKDIAGVAKAARSGAFKFRYVPGVHSGTLTIRVDALDGSGATIAGGTAPPVDLADGKAVDAILTLAINGNGITCMDGSECMSGNCVDGVCCDTACDGACESCNLAGTVGACTAAMQGTDPDNDCAAKMPPQPGDGGVDSDGGGDADGGATMSGGTGPGLDIQACAGTCNGARACTYPDATTSCGGSFCPASASVGSFACDGNGSCTENDNMCSGYVCDPTTSSCKTACGTDADCDPTRYCDLNTTMCVPRHVNGANCTSGDQCATGFCANMVCCDSSCSDQGQSCNNPGTLGKCQCTGVTCDAGVSCVLFYRDSEPDGYGDADGTILNGNAVAGCASGTNSTPPSGFVANHGDCDDHDGNVNPAQTGWFTTPSLGKGTFDYNCSGSTEKETPEILGGSCQFCQYGGLGSTCGKDAACGTAGNGSAFTCGVTRVGSFFCLCCSITTQAFTSTIPCGQVGSRTNCGTCSAAGGGPNNSTSSVQQRCH